MKWIVGAALLLSVMTMLAGCTGADSSAPPAGSATEQPAAQPATQPAEQPVEQPAGRSETQPAASSPTTGAAASKDADVDSQKVAGAMGKALMKGFGGGTKAKDDSGY